MNKLTEKQFNELMQALTVEDLEYIILGDRATEWERAIEMYKKYFGENKNE